MRPRLNLVVITVLALPVWLPTLGAADDGLPGEQQVAKLIVALGSTAFLEREQATQSLAAIGEAALPQLRTVSQAADFEVRHRAQLLRERIEEEKFARLSQSFLLDLNDQNSYGLPAWATYSDLLGGSRTSKLLFLEMLREQPDVARLVEQANDLPAISQEQQQLASTACQQAVEIRENLYSSLVEPQIGDIVGLLLAAAVLDAPTPVEISDVIVNNEHRNFGGLIHMQGYASCLRKLMAAWLPKTHDAFAPAAMDIATRHHLPQGADIARRHLTANFDSDTRKLAFYCLARFGDETDIPRLLPLLDENSVVDEFDRVHGRSGIHESNSAPPGVVEDATVDDNFVVRVNDMALATIMLLSGEDPRPVFANFEAHPLAGFFVHSLAAPTQSSVERTEKIEQWKRRLLPADAGT